MSEFGVHKASFDGDRAFVAGRCFTGPIRVGAVFTQLRRFHPVQTENGIPVELVVTRIIAYGHQLDEIQEGLTAELELSGVTPSELGDGALLAT